MHPVLGLVGWLLLGSCATHALLCRVIHSHPVQRGCRQPCQLSRCLQVFPGTAAPLNAARLRATLFPPLAQDTVAQQVEQPVQTEGAGSADQPSVQPEA